MGIEGGLTIALDLAGNGVGRATIGSTRPVHASRLFHGKGVAEALKLVPMLFSICGTAQACAAVRACEQALGVTPQPETERLREGLVRLESVREHLWRILLDWPALVGESPQQGGMAEAVALQRDIRQGLCGKSDPFQPGWYFSDAAGLSDEMAQRLVILPSETVFGMPVDEWLALDSEEGLAAWASAGKTVAARLIARVMNNGWNGIGHSGVSALPLLDNASLHHLMQADEFIERPQWQGNCYETTCLNRTDSTLLQSLNKRYGNGLLVRLVARLTELAQLSTGLLPEDRNFESAATESVTGIGRATVARGELLHRVTVFEDTIVDYRIVAPTEWNFHPHGVVAASLTTLQGNDIEPQARLLINAIDPCVAFELRIG